MVSTGDLPTGSARNQQVRSTSISLRCAVAIRIALMRSATPPRRIAAGVNEKICSTAMRRKVSVCYGRAGSSGKSLLVVEQVTVINGSEWLLEASGAISSNLQQTVSKAGWRLAQAIKTLTKSFCDRLGHIFAGQLRKLLCQLPDLCILDV